MKTRSTIAIIGASGKLGSALSKLMALAGFPLILFSRDRQRNENLRYELLHTAPDANIQISCCSYDASWEADIILPAIPYQQQAVIAAKIAEVATRKIVVSVTNPDPLALMEITDRGAGSAAEELQHALLNAYVVKAFNIHPSTAYLTGMSVPPDIEIAGDNPSAVETIRNIAESMGLTSTIAGRLDRSRDMEIRGYRNGNAPKVSSTDHQKIST